MSTLHDIKHRMKHYHVRYLLGGLALLQVLIWAGVTIWNQQDIMPVDELWEAGKYEQLAIREDAWGVLGKLMLGRVDESIDAFASREYPDLPAWSLPIKKALFLVQKKEYVGADQVLSAESSQDPTIRAVYLALRAYLFCLQKKAQECAILATDANTLDPLSPFALQMFAVGNAAIRFWEPAEDAFQRAEKLGAVCVAPVCVWYRSLVAFYRGKNLTGVQADLVTLVASEQWGDEAQLYLGRTYFNQKNWQEAKKRFETLREKKGGNDWTAEMWLARMYREQEDRTGATMQYLLTYETDKFGLEFITDYIYFAYTQHDTVLLDQLIAKASALIRSSVRGHRDLARVMRHVGKLDLAEQYIQAGEKLAQESQDLEQQEQYHAIFTQERYHLAVARWYGAIQTGTDTVPYIETMRALSGDAQHIAFLLGLQELLFSSGTGSSSIEGIPAQELPLVKARYYLLVENPQQALKEIIAGGTGSLLPDEKLLWMKRAIVTHLEQQDLIEKYMSQLEENSLLPDGFAQWNKKGKRTYVFSYFRPWLPWMSEYLSNDFLWSTKQTVEEKGEETNF